MEKNFKCTVPVVPIVNDEFILKELCKFGGAVVTDASIPQEIVRLLKNHKLANIPSFVCPKNFIPDNFYNKYFEKMHLSSDNNETVVPAVFVNIDIENDEDISLDSIIDDIQGRINPMVGIYVELKKDILSMSSNQAERPEQFVSSNLASDVLYTAKILDVRETINGIEAEVLVCCEEIEDGFYECEEIKKQFFYLFSQLFNAVSEFRTIDVQHHRSSVFFALFNSMKEGGKGLDSKLDNLPLFLAMMTLVAGFVIDTPKKLCEYLSNSTYKSKIEFLYNLTTELLAKDRFNLLLKEDVRNQINNQNKFHWLNEEISILKRQLRDISSEMGERSLFSDDEETLKYYSALEELNLSENIQSKLEDDIARLEKLPQTSPDYNVLVQYLDTVFKLPWIKYTDKKINIKSCYSELNRNHYGMNKIKERIIDYLAIKQFNPDVKGSIMCLVGPPGVGKTTIARSIAKGLGRKFVSMRLGGMSDESELRGHRKTYVGAMPGRIMQNLINCEVNNPVFLLDEVDKLGYGGKGDPRSALLEILDPEQNFEFVDAYIEVPFDLSNVMFIATANYFDDIPPALRDRMEIIDVSSYTFIEKFEIAKKHLIPKMREKLELTSEQVSFTDIAIKELIKGYTREAGVRELERVITSCFRKAVRKIVEGTETNIKINKSNYQEYAGIQKYFDESVNKKSEIGIINGLAWTSVGGELLKIEAATMDGHGNLQLTGSLGDVMKESALAGISYLRMNANRYAIDTMFRNSKDIHIHMPEGAVPKDGPSAGVAIATAVASSLTKRPIRHDVAITGEITLTGKVLPVGGIREKVLAAKRYGINTVILPKENQRDVLSDLPEKVREDIEFIYVENLDEVLQIMLKKPEVPEQKIIFKNNVEKREIGFSMDALVDKHLQNRRIL